MRHRTPSHIGKDGKPYYKYGGGIIETEKSNTMTPEQQAAIEQEAQIIRKHFVAIANYHRTNKGDDDWMCKKYLSELRRAARPRSKRSD